MDKLLAIFKNVWFRRGVAVLCLGYTVLVIWIAYLCFGYYFDITNPTPLFVLYLFVNIVAMGLLILSRKQLLTQINSYFLPPIIFTIVIFGFGNWYIIIPPMVVMVVIFFANNSNETLKTVLGTLYLLMYVIGIVGFIGAQIFMGTITLTGVDLSKRDREYEKLSESGEYRIVRYFDTIGDRKVQTYYVEETEDDIKIPLGICKKVLGCQSIYTATYESTPADLVTWITRKVDGKKEERLMVDSVERENPIPIVKKQKEEEKKAKDKKDESSSSKGLSTNLIITSTSSDSSADLENTPQDSEQSSLE